MKIQFHSIQQRILIWSGACMLLIAGSIVIYSVTSLRATAMRTAEEGIQNEATALGARIEFKLRSAADGAQQLAHALARSKEESGKIRLTLDRYGLAGLLALRLEQSDDYLATFSCWEVDAFDELDFGYADTFGHDATGRAITKIIRDAEGAVSLTILTDYESEVRLPSGERKGEFYIGPRQTGLAHVGVPDWVETPSGSTFATRISIPIILGETFLGVAGIDLGLGFVQKDSTVENLFGGSAIATVTSQINSTIADSSDSSRVGTTHGVAHVSEEFLESSVSIDWSDQVDPWTLSLRVPWSVVTAEADALMRRQVMLSVLAIVIGLALLWILGRTIARPVISAAKMLKGIGEEGGNLTERLAMDAVGEVGELATGFNDFVSGMQGTIITIRDMTNELEGASRQGSEGSLVVSRGSQKQSESIHHISSALSAMKKQAEGTVDFAKKADDASDHARESADSGMIEMESLSKAMSEIQESSGRIADVIQAIDSISFQTNLLSLNAAVEAARAGEAGSGFAVVAKEVRELARRCSEEAAITAGIVDESRERANRGVEIAQRLDQLFDGIRANSETVNGLLDTISSASRDQAVGIDSINDQVGGLESVILHNTAVAEELASSAEQSAEQVRLLRGLVDSFEV